MDILLILEGSTFHSQITIFNLKTPQSTVNTLKQEHISNIYLLI